MVGGSRRCRRPRHRSSGSWPATMAMAARPWKPWCPGGQPARRPRPCFGQRPGGSPPGKAPWRGLAVGFCAVAAWFQAPAGAFAACRGTEQRRKATRSPRVFGARRVVWQSSVRAVAGEGPLGCTQAKRELLHAVLQGDSGARETNSSALIVDGLVEHLGASAGGMRFCEDLVQGHWVLVFTRNAKGAPVSQKLSRTKPGNTFANFNEMGKFENVVKFLRGWGRLSATVEYTPDASRPARISCDITRADVSFGRLRIPLPLRAKGGWLDFLYLDEDMRITRGNRGGTFVHVRPEKLQECLSS